LRTILIGGVGSDSSKISPLLIGIDPGAEPPMSGLWQIALVQPNNIPS
jgi:hypothetical protein